MTTIYSERDNIRRYAAALTVLMIMLAVKILACRVCV